MFHVNFVIKNRYYKQNCANPTKFLMTNFSAGSQGSPVWSRDPSDPAAGVRQGQHQDGQEQAGWHPQPPSLPAKPWANVHWQRPMWVLQPFDHPSVCLCMCLSDRPSVRLYVCPWAHCNFFQCCHFLWLWISPVMRWLDSCPVSSNNSWFAVYIGGAFVLQLWLYKKNGDCPGWWSMKHFVLMVLRLSSHESLMLYLLVICNKKWIISKEFLRNQIMCSCVIMGELD